MTTDEQIYFYKLNKRIEAGAKEYGDSSFKRPSHDLIEMMQEEILDIAGWGYVLWQRLEILKRDTKSL